MTRLDLSPASGLLLMGLVTVGLGLFLAAVFVRQHPVAAGFFGGALLAVGLCLLTIDRCARRITG